MFVEVNSRYYIKQSIDLVVFRQYVQHPGNPWNFNSLNAYHQ